MALNQPFNLCLQWLRSMEWRPAENLCFSVASWLFYHYSCTEQVSLMVLRKCCSVVLDCLGAVLMIWLLLQSRLKQKTPSILHWHPEEQQSIYGLTDLYTHTLPARLNMSLNKTRGIHRRSDPGWQTSPVMVRESIRQNHLTEWVGPLLQQKTVSHFSLLLSTCWSLWSQTLMLPWSICEPITMLQHLRGQKWWLTSKSNEAIKNQNGTPLLPNGYFLPPENRYWHVGHHSHGDTWVLHPLWFASLDS